MTTLERRYYIPEDKWLTNYVAIVDLLWMVITNFLFSLSNDDSSFWFLMTWIFTIFTFVQSTTNLIYCFFFSYIQKLMINVITLLIFFFFCSSNNYVVVSCGCLKYYKNFFPFLIFWDFFLVFHYKRWNKMNLILMKGQELRYCVINNDLW